MSDPNSENPVHTLASLLKALGPATMEEVLPLVEGHDKPSLVRDGAQVSTARISTDSARMYGQIFDFFGRASEDQLDQLPTYTRNVLRIAVWAASEGDALFHQLKDQNNGEAGKQSAALAGAEKVAQIAEAKRDQLHTALVGLAAGDKQLLAQVQNAYGTAADIPGSIKLQASLARAWLARPPGNMAVRLRNTRLTDDWLRKAEQAGADLAAAQKAASATRSQGQLTPADVDYLDGINLVLLGNAVAQFEAAHGADATIPRLSYNSLRSHVHRSHHAAQTQPQASAAGSTPAAKP